jgi:hypothetical protein
LQLADVIADSRLSHLALADKTPIGWRCDFASLLLEVSMSG